MGQRSGDNLVADCVLRRNGKCAVVLSLVSGVAKVEASRAGLFTGMIPISAALVAVLFLGEAFTWMHAIGMSLVLGSIVVGTMRTGKKGATLET
jgi:drug/metabolite transporter (DMT)-like permease